MSDLGDAAFSVARQAINSLLHNVLSSRSVPILFHKSPGNDSGGDRAIPGIDWQVRAQGFLIQNGTTGNNGRIDMNIRGGSSTLELLDNGNVVAEYEVTASTAALAAATTVRGQKERMRLLGYQLGHGGPDGNGVDNNANVVEYERSILDVQADHGQTSDANVTANTRNSLTTDAGA